MTWNCKHYPHHCLQETWFSHDIYDSNDDYWLITRNVVTVTFHKDEQGLLYIDVKGQGFTFVQTVRESFEGCTKKDMKKATAAREAPT